MSHTTTVKSCPIRSVSALKSAIRKLQKNGVKCELVEDTFCKLYFESQSREIGKCEYVLKLENSPYDVGFKKNSEGIYDIKMDEYAGHTAKKLGGKAPIQEGQDSSAHAIGQLLSAYSEEAVIETALEQGYMVESATYNETTGETELILGGF